jgi:hypothetical protein
MVNGNGPLLINSVVSKKTPSPLDVWKKAFRFKAELMLEKSCRFLDSSIGRATDC